MTNILKLKKWIRFLDRCFKIEGIFCVDLFIKFKIVYKKFLIFFRKFFVFLCNFKYKKVDAKEQPSSSEIIFFSYWFVYWNFELLFWSYLIISSHFFNLRCTTLAVVTYCRCTTYPKWYEKKISAIIFERNMIPKKYWFSLFSNEIWHKKSLSVIILK